jgi:ABC-type sugar transport system substrate-binding protein
MIDDPREGGMDMMKRGRRLAVAAVLAVAGALAAGGGAALAAPAGVGDKAPDFGGTWFNWPAGNATLAELEGRVVLVEFWRTW